MNNLQPEDLPLHGVLVVEFCSVAAGPFCSMLLADMGAEVVKIEPTAGDTLRAWPPITEGFSENFASLNRNKKSVVLDLKSPDGLNRALDIIDKADIVLENNRPGAMDRLGLGASLLLDKYPELIYCSISAYGQTGPRATEGGFDLTIQAASGVMSVTGDSDRPVKCGVPISDFTAGLYGAFAIVSALRRVQAGGRGAHIDIPMFGCTLAVAALQISEFFGSGRSPGKTGSAHPRNAPYQAFKAADGYFAIAAGNDKLWQAVLSVVNRPDLVSDPLFKSTALRAENQKPLQEILESDFVRKPVDHWIDAFRQAGVPHSRINDYAQALADPQVAHMNWVQQMALSNGRTISTFATPFRLDGKELPIRRSPPALGADNDWMYDDVLKGD